jgi:hypothetical protein
VDAWGTVSWTAAPAGESDPPVAFNIYRGGVLATPTPLAAPPFRDLARASGASYQVTAIDAAGNESAPSAAVAPAGGDSRCFIATAAFGSPLDARVQALRDFRDRRLLTSRPGRALVELYYRWSPGAADFIRRHEPVRRAARWALIPVVAAVEHPFLACLSGGCAAIAALATLLRRRMRSR